MVPIAPRYDSCIERLVRELDDPAESMAETCRRVGDRAQRLGFVRPSLVHLRTLVRAEREARAAQAARREAQLELVRLVLWDNAKGRVTSVPYLLERIAQLPPA